MLCQLSLKWWFRLSNSKIHILLSCFLLSLLCLFKQSITLRSGSGNLILEVCRSNSRQAINITFSSRTSRWNKRTLSLQIWYWVLSYDTILICPIVRIWICQLLLEYFIFFFSCYNVNIYCYSLQMYPPPSSLSLLLFPLTLGGERHPIVCIDPHGNLQLAVLLHTSAPED